MALNESVPTEDDENKGIELPCSEVVLAEMHKLIWETPKIRSYIQEKYGFSIIPSNFYSNIPSIREIEESFEYRDDGNCYGALGLFDEKRLLEILADLMVYCHEFDPPSQGSETKCEKFFWENSQFSFSDAMAYYAFIRAYKPNKILEIGSGFSTLIAIEALDNNRSGSVTCIEPFPRDFLELLNVEIIKKKIQDTPLDEIIKLLDNGDFLFIDSTHTVKTGSDCLRIYLNLLPSIKKDIFVQVHDIFLPFALPKLWATDLHIYWTEQYLLLALLINNPKIEILYGSAFHKEKNPNLLDKFMVGRAISGGSSLWFRYNGESCA